MTIEQIVLKVYKDYEKARMPKSGVETPEDKLYSSGEVSMLVTTIINTVNSHIASFFLNEKQGD